MGPFLPDRTDVRDQTEIDPDGDDIYNDIMEQTALANESLEEGQQLTDNTKLQHKLQLQDVRIESLKQMLDTKAKQLLELTEQLKCKKADAGQHQNQRSNNFNGMFFVVHFPQVIDQCVVASFLSSRGRNIQGYKKVLFEIWS